MSIQRHTARAQRQRHAVRTFAEIGAALGISRTRAHQLYLRAVSKVLRRCRLLGVRIEDLLLP